ncbi:MAG: tyrosine-type recombinase/integrase [Victivallales bacterium]|nr:tyrosine-type recombinase/integrase [Victivallales bacterium]
MAKKVVKLDIGTVYQKTEKGSYYFRYQINGQRKAVSLKTKNQKEAISKAQELIPVVKATTTEVISAHVKQARGLVSKAKALPLISSWEVYAQHPDRAAPATVHEHYCYKSTFDEFIKFIDNSMLSINDISSEMADKFAQYLRNTNISVETHNRKIRRLKRIFDVLDEYRNSANPFLAMSLRRKEREEQDNISARRMSFSQEQELKLLEVLENSKYKVKNKPEIRLIYYLGMLTGQRLKDCVLLRWDKVDLNRKRIWVKQFKTGKSVTIPMAPKLLEVLTEAQKWKTGPYVCPNVAKRYNQLDKNGKNTGNNLVNIDVLRVIKWIGLEPSVEVPGRKKKVTVYGFHSLRHSFALHCAEAGVPKAVVLSILGANSEIVDKHYTHIGEAAQEQAIQSLFGTTNTISAQEKISKALAVIDDWKDKPEKAIEIEQILRS